MERTFHNDPDFPPPPIGVVFTDPVVNMGPDADKFRDPADGLVKDASDEGMAISTFTPHSSPLGLVFDTEFALDGEWAGDGFCLSQNDADRRKYKPFGDPGEDLLHLDLAKTADGERYGVRITRLVQGFRSPVDAVMRGNRIYVLEYGDNGRLWEVALPPRRADTAVLDEGAQAAVFALAPNFPNPFNAGTAITYRLPAAGMATLRVYNTRGQVGGASGLVSNFGSDLTYLSLPPSPVVGSENNGTAPGASRAPKHCGACCSLPCASHSPIPPTRLPRGTSLPS